MNYGYRYYSPYLGRWLSKDPIGDAGGNNLYAYPHNSAVNQNDLLGLASCAEICKEMNDTKAGQKACIKMVLTGQSIPQSGGRIAGTAGVGVDTSLLTQCEKNPVHQAEGFVMTFGMHTVGRVVAQIMDAFGVKNPANFNSMEGMAEAYRDQTYIDSLKKMAAKQGCNC
jgi:uncharacterized protein RhaS with RHS repeats